MGVNPRKGQTMTKKQPSKRIRNRTQIPTINMPEIPGNEAYTIIGKHILFVSVDYDHDVGNPCEEMDGVGTIRSLGRRHINRIDAVEALELLKEDPDVIPLSYFEHGNCLWMVQELPAPAGVEFQWDGVRFAGVWIPDDCVRESYTGQDGLSRRDWMVQQAKSACEIYTQWTNGEVYGYNVELFKLFKDDAGNEYTNWDDYRFGKAISEDSCWGFYGWDHLMEEVMVVVRGALKELGFSKRAIATATKEVL